MLDACLEVIGAEGVASTTVDAICERAGLTKRYFYESFANLEAIFSGVIDEMFDVIQGTIRAALVEAGPTVSDRAHATAGVLVRALDEDRRLARLYVEAPAHPALHERRDVAVGAYSQLLMGEVLRVDPADPRGQVGALLIVAGTTEVVSRWLAGEIDLDGDGLVEEIARIGVAITGTA